VIGTSPAGNARRDRCLGGFLVRRECWTFSRSAKLLMVAMVLGVVLMLKEFLHPFLAAADRIPADVLVVEGWSPPYAMKQAVAEYWSAGYKRILVTHALFDPQDEDFRNPLSTDYTMRVLIKFGAPRGRVETVVFPAVDKDRTFHSALAVKRWLRQQGLSVAALDVATMGTHARRSRLLYEKAFGSEVKIGIIPLRDAQYDPTRWWASSEGVREVLSEGIAYLYARLLFHPSGTDSGSFGN
jgi:hypothetical protein